MQSHKEVQFVITMKVEKGPFALTIECWTWIPSRHRHTRRPSEWTISNDQIFQIDAAGEVTSASPALCIPYNAIFDEDHDNATEIKVTKAELKAYARRVFHLIHL